jgi:type IV pilus assembly protein PilY1
VFVGANDGMLHAFRVGWLSAYNPPNEPLKLTDAFSLTSTDLIGKEEWAFIPQNALPYLLWLGHKDYCHVPTVDYRVSVFDAKDSTTGQWRTYLLGMMGFGGKAISVNGTTYSSSLFLLDLTDWLNGGARPTLKWEITLPDNTLTLSYPQVVKLSNGTDWSKTYVVIGSGPKEVTGTGTPYTISFVGEPKIYFISLANGRIVKNLTIPDNNIAVGHLRAVDFDNDYVDDLIYFGTYNETSGNLYRISFKNTDGSYKDVSSLSDGDIKQVFNSYPGKPVFSAPQMTFDQSRNLWVVFGTGHYLTRNYPATNYFIGFKDTCYLGNCTINFSDLVDRTNYCTNNSTYNATIVYNSTETTCTCTETGCSQTSEGALYQFIYSPATTGWYHELTSNEQMYSSVFILNYMVNALSFRPTEDICSAGGETYYWMVCLVEGCPCYSLRGETSPVVSKFIAFGAPPIGQPFQPLKTEKGTTLFTQTSAGGIIQAPNPLRATLRGKFILWIEK